MEETKTYIITAGADAPVIYEYLQDSTFLGSVSTDPKNGTTQFEIELNILGHHVLMVNLALREFTIQEKVL